MSRATADEQQRFLLSCVKHSNHGKVDFVEVAKECGVVSKGAAAKRYERLLKASGLTANAVSSAIPFSKAATPKQRAAADAEERLPVPKRRKTDRDQAASMAKGDEQMRISDPPAISLGPSQAGEGRRSKSEMVRHSIENTVAGPTVMPPLSVPTTYPARAPGHGLPAPGYSFFSPMPYFESASGAQAPPGPPSYLRHPYLPVARDPWAIPIQERSSPMNDFGEYAYQGLYSQAHQTALQGPHQAIAPIEGPPVRLPPQPQEVVPMLDQKQAGETAGPSTTRASQPGGNFVVVD